MQRHLNISTQSPCRVAGMQGTLIASIFLFGLLAQGQSLPLPIGQTIHRDITAPATLIFRTSLTGGQVILVSLEQQQLHLALEVRSSDGTVLAKSNRHAAWTEKIVFEAPASAEYQVAVITSKLSLMGGFKLRSERHDSTTQNDRLEVQAEHLSQEAFEQRSKHSAGFDADTLRKVSQANPLWLQLGNNDEVAYDKLTIVAVERFRGQHAKSLATAQEALALFQKSGNAAGEASAARAAGVANALMGNSEAALDFFKKALALSQRVNDIEGLPERYVDLGTVYSTMLRSDEAIDALRQTVDLSHKLNKPVQEASAFHNLSELAVHQGRYTDSIDYSEKAISILRRIGDRYLEGIALQTLGETWKIVGELHKAVAVFEQSLAIRRQLQDVDGTTATLEGLADANILLGRYDVANSELAEARTLQTETDNRVDLPFTLATQAKIYRLTGQYDKALDLYQQSVEASRRQSQPAPEASALADIAAMFNYLGDDDRAIEYAERSIKIYRGIHSSTEVGPLKTLGDAYLHKGQADQADGYAERMLSLSRQSKAKIEEAVALMELALVKTAQGQREGASQNLIAALAITREIQDPNLEGTALTQLGSLYGEMGRLAESRQVLEQSLTVYRRLKSDPDISVVLYQLARIEKKAGRLPEAQALIENSLRLSEALRAKLYNPASRLSWFASVQEANKLYIDTLMDRHRKGANDNFDVLAFEASERGKARSLLDSLRESSMNVNQDASSELVEREKRLAEQINALEAERFKLLAIKLGDRVETIERDLEDLQIQLEQLQGEIRRTSPHYALLTQSSTIGLRRIQAELDEDTLLLEYSLGEKRSFLWAVGRHSFQNYELQSEKEIQTATEQVCRLVTSRGRTEPLETVAMREARIARSEVDFSGAVRQLSVMLLNPVVPQMKGKRLVIVTDGALAYLPFALLSGAIASSGEAATYRPLVIDHEITMLPSSSTIVVERQMLSGRQQPPKVLAVFADPVFTARDERMEATAKAHSPPGPTTDLIAETRLLEHLTDAPTADSEVTTIRIPRLRFTADEATRIAALVPSNEKYEAIGFQANRTNALRPDLKEYQYVHFATHGWLDNQHPERSALILSMLDARGNPQSGLLRVSDIYNLRLPAQLVTLSACQTGLGKQIRGEGLIGLTQAFLYAGAARVAVSLWNVNDEETAELMALFYEGILKRHLRPTAALRSAQVSILQQQRWRFPYYWAAFTLEGEWR